MGSSVWMGPGRVGKEGGGEEKHILCGKRQRREREAGARRMESWVKGFGKMQGGKEGRGHRRRG